MSAWNDRDPSAAHESEIEPDGDEITEDLTIDGADLLASLQEEHASRQVSQPMDDGDDELTVDGSELLLEIRRSLESEGSHSSPRPAGVDEHTVERWRPAPVLPPSEAVVATRAGRASRMQLGVITLVVAAAFAVGGYLIAGIVAGDAAETGSEEELSE